MIKKKFEYTFFILLNIFLSSFKLSGIILLFPAIIIGHVLTVLFGNFIEIKDDLDFSIMLSLYLAPVTSLLFKIIIFPLIYKIKFLNNIKELLERFANDKKFSWKMLLLILIFDIIIYIFTEIFTGNNILKDSIKMYLYSLILFGGGVFPCYLSFLLWYKLTHRNKTKIAQNSIRAL